MQIKSSVAEAIQGKCVHLAALMQVLVFVNHKATTNSSEAEAIQEKCVHLAALMQVLVFVELDKQLFNILDT